MPRPASKSTVLRAYLADRDLPCEGCRYNLRGVTDVYCPECGRVIPAPPAEFTIRSRTDPASLRLACRECGYVVTGANVERCPECGAEGLERFVGQNPPPRRRKRLGRWLPVPLALLGLVSVCIALAALAMGLVSQFGVRRGFGPSISPWHGVMLAAGPIAIACAWLWWRPLLARLDSTERRLLAALATLVSLAMTVAAMAALR